MVQPGILVDNVSPNPLQAVMHSDPRYPCSVPSQDRSELKPRVIGKEEEKRLPLPLASLLTHGENLSVLSLSPCTLVLYC